ncbi:hypothetical protein [Sphingomonas sp. 37zxx]|uniref:hypothetical protein n=1 Tax=Sphingomonas sp. 37zxx TaxID=1550073 RepID=UPI00053C02D6|nr:hypothetical protein [Sphingomonas sp. 37zxx]
MAEPIGPGELAAARQRRRLMVTVGILAAVGFFAGLGTALVEDESSGTLPAGWAIAMVVIGVTAICLGSWRLWKQADEYDRRDHLAATTMGLNVYLLLYPSWFVLAKGKVVGEPDDLIIFIATYLAAAGTYGWRKLRR